MSNYLRNNDDASRQTISPIRRRRVWLATGVVGLTGAVSLAGVAYATTGAVGPHRLTDVKWSTTQQLSDDGVKGDEKDRRDEEGRDGKDRDRRGEEGNKREERDEHGRVREVPCNDDKLIEAIDLANRDHGGTLKLSPHCVYELDFADKKSGTALPTIRQEITIKGNDATIKRDSEDAFRLFRVADGGDLTLTDLTLKDGNAAEFKYGQAPSGPPSGPQSGPPSGPPSGPSGPSKEKKEGEADGGALLVERGGSAHLKKVDLTRNNAEGNGGAIANFGRVDLELSNVENNHAQRNGGGIFNVGVLRIKESRIKNNTAGKNGGGIANGEGNEKDKDKGKEVWVKGRDEAGTVEILGRLEGKEVGKTEIENNRAGENGGGLFSSGGFVRIFLTSIKNNTACENGGGIYARNTDLDLKKVIIANNHADRDGGGVYNTGGEKKKEALYGDQKDQKEENKREATATIADSTIVDNSAGRFGGGIFNGDPDVKIKEGYLESDDKDNREKKDEEEKAVLTIRDTEIKNNTAQNGGGIFNNEGGKTTLTKSRVTKNTATDSSKTHRVAGGIFNNGDKDDVRLDEKTTVTDNDPTNCAGTVKDCFN
ncbi:hypothetical protein [Micromonospora eburnea]|uniref:Polymorphic outer membrane protein repeat-containing protein n=1 Tax=Micromonospora eburnea TaxID=227316 RepID=A0A1C6V3K7_9ACTN|nr:hypothetical protein [Micromonospora eburnea]SCL60952.1 polymorphic outer membrane protein repeat-containing protein [Micromonospora eburnea]